MDFGSILTYAADGIPIEYVRTCIYFYAKNAMCGSSGRSTYKEEEEY